MKQQTTVFLMSLVSLVVCQIPTAEPTIAGVSGGPTAEPTAAPVVYKNVGGGQAAQLAIGIIVLVAVVCCCGGFCFRNQIKARYMAYRFGADGSQQAQHQQQQGNYGNYPPQQSMIGGTTTSAPVVPVAQTAINRMGMGMVVFGPDGKLV